MRRFSRIIKWLTLGLLLAVLGIGIFSALFFWEGMCEVSGQLIPCTRWEFAWREMFWGTFLFIPFLFILTLVYLGITLVQFIASLVRKILSKRRS